MVHLIISLREGFFPYIKIPVLKIFAPSHAKNNINIELDKIEHAIWKKEGIAILILINIRVGVKRGKNEASTTIDVFGF